MYTVHNLAITVAGKSVCLGDVEQLCQTWHRRATLFAFCLADADATKATPRYVAGKLASQGTRRRRY